MLPAAARVARRPQGLLRTATGGRTFASHVPSVSTQTSSVPGRRAAPNSDGSAPVGAKEGALRPHLGIQVNPDHGLYAFFRKRHDSSTGAVVYDTIEGNAVDVAITGRSWTAKELRLKSFQDLHTLWYILLRERNLLATQKEECRRLRIDPSSINVSAKAALCRKSMARIKYVLNERRLAYLTADKMQRAEEKKPAEEARQASARELHRRQRESARASRQKYLVTLLEQKQAEEARKAAGTKASAGEKASVAVEGQAKETAEAAEPEVALSQADREALELLAKRKQAREEKEAREAAKAKAAKEQEELERVQRQPAGLASAGLFGDADKPGKSS
ncbi:MRP-L47-domain-containing protein [Punctularia strigosozonata HHB-11173 SS5]|uniref:MRP-L47-domain-containing protein n=1 Tax=Punctularia strigosozonata (strain HHB-11173) TaxID=741275 RepID=UPI000441629C|nr:MRP-L47-domain-containing protein [Punctularia strigosozonata HHB-11173 SS5]EIN12629.1 MRP-L47-domain-containing protein [Punctularia strigosozonata HHB-11173 SS5]